MTEHIRIYWHSMRGRNTLNFNWGAVDSDSIVHVSASEYRAKGQPLFVGAQPVPQDLRERDVKGSESPIRLSRSRR